MHTSIRDLRLHFAFLAYLYLALVSANPVVGQVPSSPDSAAHSSQSVGPRQSTTADSAGQDATGYPASWYEKAPRLNDGSPEEVASEGYFTLYWSVDDEVTAEIAMQPRFELIEADDAAFDSARTIYRGADLASTISGKPNGTLYYRVRLTNDDATVASPWSNVHSVMVRHHSLGRAFSFLAIGAIVFVATLSLILAGHRGEGKAVAAARRAEVPRGQ